MDLAIIGEMTSRSEVNVSASPYRLFVSTLPTYKEAEAHFEQFPCPEYPGEEEGLERNTLLLEGLGKLALRAKPGSLDAKC